MLSPLTDRAVISLQGPDIVSFLQGLITVDVEKLSENTPLYSAILNPQGRFLHDFFLIQHQDSVLIDCEQNSLNDLLRRLKMYKLRSQVTLTDLSKQYQVYAIQSDDPDDFKNIDTGILYRDPRHRDLGYRLIIDHSANFSFDRPQQTLDDYQVVCMKMGIPYGQRDMIYEKGIALECGLDELGAISWEKGCYLGQELNARTKHRGLVRKRLLPFRYEGKAPDIGSELRENDHKIGLVRSTLNGYGIGMFRIEYFESRMPKTVINSDSEITISIPDWVIL